MPPSGFSQKAINGLLVFVKASYEHTLLQYGSQIKHKSESIFLTETVGFLEQIVQGTIEKTPLSVSNEAVRGMTTFVTSCYEDLIKEIYVGKDKYERSVIEGKAIQKEINQIADYLSKFTI